MTNNKKSLRRIYLWQTRLNNKCLNKKFHQKILNKNQTTSSPQRNNNLPKVNKA